MTRQHQEVAGAAHRGTSKSRSGTSAQLFTCRASLLLRARRLYVSNMVVAPGARRRGVATELLHACTRLGTHVDAATLCCPAQSIEMIVLSLIGRACRQGQGRLENFLVAASTSMCVQADGGGVTAPGCMWRSGTQRGWASTRCTTDDLVSNNTTLFPCVLMCTGSPMPILQ